MLGVWDPYFGWDFYRIRAMFGAILLLSLFAMFVAGTEGLAWYYPFNYVWSGLAAHPSEVITFFIFTSVGLFWYWKYQSGGL